MNRALLPACAALLMFSAAAWAQPGGPPPGGIGGPPMGGLFISPDGEPFRGPNGLADWFAGADADHDGALTLAEFRADAMRFFKVLDANSDGRIDGTENGVYETRIAPEITRTGLDDDRGGRPGGPAGGRGGDRDGGGMRGGHGGGPPGGGGMGGGGMGGGGMGGGGPPGGGEGGPRPSRSGHGGGERREGAARFSLLNEPQPVRGADADLDWKVTADEWARAAGRRFALLDTDNDGKLTLATLPPLPGRHGPPDKRPRH